MQSAIPVKQPAIAGEKRMSMMLQTVQDSMPARGAEDSDSPETIHSRQPAMQPTMPIIRSPMHSMMPKRLSVK